MASPSSVGAGVGVTLGILALIAIALFIVGLCTSGARTRDFHRERERRVERARERHRQEQEQWRERRLRDVVLLLIERGEAREGVPLAFQLPNRPEVPARRTLRSRRGRDTQRQEMEIELANADEDSRLDPEAQEIARKPLSELLANGRPEEAEQGPDVMQLLLDGQELQQHTSSDDSDYILDDETSASMPPSLTQRTGYPSQLTSCPPTPLPQSQASPPFIPGARSTPPAATSGMSQLPNGEGRSAESPDASEIEARTAAALRMEQQRREAREAALVEELRRKRRRKRRKTAEQVYGEPSEYLHNSENALLDRRDEEDNAAPQSPLWRFLSPLSPFRGNRSRNRKSAFVDRVPEGSPTLPGGPRSPGLTSKAVKSPASPQRSKPSSHTPF
ncbi:hypothetical protein ABL78_5194 [Leptomonas seymouri]|uniref:Uncharacterized protein n=1 Tax=Leptomonas seymouri TaxID=5684 RepID=A0A0N1HX69_LEPSE|nr:hypothetical protein ABL78_5194 [Leptomonas seymouri]|eukprot:KPI85745.1 hypothetical protein ABL78_5194 [Leptomonas seymouri]